jgi:hypothetical protein
MELSKPTISEESTSYILIVFKNLMHTHIYTFMEWLHNTKPGIYYYNYYYTNDNILNLILKCENIIYSKYIYNFYKFDGKKQFIFDGNIYYINWFYTSNDVIKIDTNIEFKKSSKYQYYEGESSKFQYYEGETSKFQYYEKKSSKYQYYEEKSSKYQDYEGESSKYQDYEEESSKYQDYEGESSKYQDYEGESSKYKDYEEESVRIKKDYEELLDKYNILLNKNKQLYNYNIETKKIYKQRKHFLHKELKNKRK